jgi:biopolymer transport protein ExbB/TolQ
MAWLVLVVLAAAGPVLMALLIVKATAIVDLMESALQVLRRRRPVPESPPIEDLAADLRRLGSQLAQVESSNEIAKAFRLTAASRAYDDVLLSACRVLEVDTMARAPLRPVERLETEAALAMHGLRW